MVELVAKDRMTAQLIGLRFYEGSACKCGRSIRYVANKTCASCTREKALEDFYANRRFNYPTKFPRQATRYDEWLQIDRDDIAFDQATALLIGARYYFGRTCVNGHKSIRYASCSGCVECSVVSRRHRRARERGASGNHTHQEAQAVLALQGFRCAYCGTEENLTLDHKIPLSRGGTNDAGNLQWLCGSDNSRKRDKTDLEYRLLYDVPLVTPWDAKE